MKRHPLTLLAVALSMALSSCSSPMKTTTEVKRLMFLPPPLADEWSHWIVGEWEGAGESDTGRGSGIERTEFALNGQFLISHGEATITEMTPDQAAYLRKNMHASDEEIARFKASPYRSLEIFTTDPNTGEVVGFSFDSLRCIATGRGRREGDRQIIDWEWSNGHKSTRITERVSADRMVITQLTPMLDGSVMEEKGIATRRAPWSPAAAPDSTEVAAVKRFIAAINSQDFAALSTLIPDDHQFVDSGGVVVAGREPMLAGWQRYFAMFPDYRIKVDLMLQNGAIVAAFGSWSATYAGKRGSVPENALGGPAVWRALIEDGRIRTWQVYTDHTKTAEVMKQSEQQPEKRR